MQELKDLLELTEELSLELDIDKLSSTSSREEFEEDDNELSDSLAEQYGAATDDNIAQIAITDKNFFFINI